MQNNGKHFSIKKIVTEELVEQFAKVSGDTNPIHLDDEAATNSIFGRRVAHGMLTASFISAILGNHFPGNGTIYLAQELSFLRPVYIGDSVEVVVELESVDEKQKAWLRTNVYDDHGALVVKGKARVKLPADFSD